MIHRLSKAVTLLLAGAVLCLGMTGCREPSSAASPSPDICEKVAGIPADTVLLTIDGREIPAEEYLYWTSLVLDTYYYYNYAGSEAADETCSWVSENWDKGLSSTVLGYLLNYNEPGIHGAELGFDPDEAEIAEAVDELVAGYKASYADEETFELYLSQICMSQAGFRRIMEESIYYQYLLDFLYYEEGEYVPSDEDVMAFADDNGYYACQYVFFSTTDCYTDEAIDRVRAKAQLLLDNLAVVEDPDAYFSAVITDSNWNDDSEEGENGLVSVGGTINAAFDEAVRSLDIGEFSGIIDNTDEYGFFVIRRLELQPEDVRDACCAYQFNQLVSRWNEDAAVEYTDAYDELDFQNFYVSLINYRLSTDDE